MAIIGYTGAVNSQIRLTSISASQYVDKLVGFSNQSSSGLGCGRSIGGGRRCSTLSAVCLSCLLVGIRMISRFSNDTPSQRRVI